MIKRSKRTNLARGGFNGLPHLIFFPDDKRWSCYPDMWEDPIGRNNVKAERFAKLKTNKERISAGKNRQGG